MENTWLQNSMRNLVPLSEAADFRLALKEWIYTGVAIDLEISEEKCGLCEHPNIRYQFEIKNKYNNNSLLVGSECINKFNILSIDANGNILDQEQSTSKLNHDKILLIKRSKEKELVNKLFELSQSDDQFKIEQFINYFQHRKAFTPKQLSLLIWRLEKLKIPYNPKLFKMIIRRQREKDQLRNMPDWKIEKLLPIMTPSQKEWLYKNTTYKKLTFPIKTKSIDYE